MANRNANLWKTYGGKGFAAEYSEYSERASADVNGNSLEVGIEGDEVTGIGSLPLHAAKADTDANGNSLSLGLDAEDKIVSIGGKEIAGTGGSGLIPPENESILGGGNGSYSWKEIGTEEVTGGSLLTTYDGMGLKAARAVGDADGNSISATYATKAELPTVNDAKLKLQLGTGTVADTGFTANSGSDVTVTIPEMEGATAQDAGSVGLVPAPTAADKDKFLKGDGTWGDVPAPATVNDAKLKLKLGSAEAVETGFTANADTDATIEIPVMSGATSLEAGGEGLVPAPTTSDTGKFLKGDGTWAELPVATTSSDGLMSATDKTNLDAAVLAEHTHANKAVLDSIPAGATANSSLTCTGTDTYEWTGWADTTVSVPKKKVEIGGRLYDYVQIGNQLWLAENLQFRWSGLSDTISSNATDTTPWGVYYANNADLYGEYGLLYNGYALRYLAENASTLLPQGWQVPYNSHFTTLLNYLGGASIAGKKLKSTAYNGTDEYGFELMISGCCTGPGYSEPFYGFGTDMQLWSATTNDARQYAYSFYPSTDNVVQYNGERVYGARYIRLVKTLA